MMRHTQGRNWLLMAAVLLVLPCTARLQGQQQPYGPARGDDDPVMFRVERASQRMEMIVNSSRILTHPNPVPRVLVNNPDIVQATPLSPNQIQLSARRTGVTQVNLWDKDQNVFTVDVIVTADARELEELLRTEFPQADVRVRPLANSVVLTGYVPTPDMIGRIVRMSEDYYSNVINNMSVGGVQQIMLHVKIVEVSRSKMRQLGIDWAASNGGDTVVSSAAGLISAVDNAAGTVSGGGQTVFLSLTNNSNTFLAYIDALRTNNLAKLLSEPTLVTVSGRPASFNVGGEFPIQVPQSLGTNSIEYRSFGTRVDFVPIVLGNGNIRLEVRPQITERDDASGVNGVPAITSRWVDTAAEMKAGQTLVLAGILQRRVENENRGIPGLADLPWAGAFFRRVEQRINEVELLIVVRPEFVEAVYPHEAPPCYPGDFTKPPNPTDFYARGYLEVPKCCNDGTCRECLGGAGGGVIYQDSIQGPVEALPAPTDGASYQQAPSQQYPYRPNQQTVRPAAVHVAPQQQQSQGSPPGNPQNRQGTSPAASGPAPVNSGNDPQLLGPMGYDVLDFNN